MGTTNLFKFILIFMLLYDKRIYNPLKNGKNSNKNHFGFYE